MSHPCYACQHGLHVHMPMCQTHANFSLLLTNVPINVPKVNQLFNLVCQRAKGMPIFQLRLLKGIPIFQLFFKRIYHFLNFSIMLTICKFQEYLGNSRKLILRKKELKFWHLQNFTQEKPCQPKTFDDVFNRPHGINQAIIRLV